MSGLTSGVSAISAGSDDSCAITTAGDAKCWGHDQSGELGIGAFTDRLKPVNVSGLPGTPKLSSFAPLTGGVGKKVTITGLNLGHATKVSFNGVVASFTVVSNTSITTTVPTAAITGKVRVTTPGGTVISTTNFTVT